MPSVEVALLPDQWFLNRLRSQTDVFPVQKNYHDDDVAAGFEYTKLLILYNLHTLRNKRGQMQDRSLELLLELFRNDQLALLLIPDAQASLEAIGHHRLAGSVMRIDLNWYLR